MLTLHTKVQNTLKQLVSKHDVSLGRLPRNDLLLVLALASRCIEPRNGS